MKTAALRCLALLAALCCLPAPAAQAAAIPRDLLAHGGEDHFWIARVVSGAPATSFESTNLLYRENFGGPWTQLQSISSRVVSLASQQGELLLALQDGQWMIADDTDIRLGPPPPFDGKILALADEQKVVWAVVSDQGPTTRSATEPSTQPAPVGPSISAPIHRWLIYRFGAGVWVTPQKLPKIDDADFDNLSLAVLNQLPVIAWKRGDGFILITRMNADGSWTTPIAVQSPSGSQDFKLLNAQGNLVLWTSSPPNAPQDSMGGQLHEGDDFSKTISLAVIGTPPPPAMPQTMAFFEERWRWLTATPTEFYEQDYELDGRTAPDYVPGSGEAEPSIPLLPYAGGASLVVIIAGAAAIAQRRSGAAPPPISSAEIMDHIAPMRIRLAAAMIDLVPALAALGAIPRSLAAAEGAACPPNQLNLSVLSRMK